jgi:Xaa-Pro dipeptidase
MRRQYLNRLTGLMKKYNMDAILIAPSEEMEFILGYNTYLCERFQALIIKNNGEYFYICNLLTKDEIQTALGSEVKVYGWFDGDIFTDTVKKAFEENDLIGKTIGVNSTERAYQIIDISNAMDINFVNGRPILEEMRMIKNDEEIENLRIAARITDETFEELLAYIKPGIKEVDIANKINEIFVRKGAKPGFAMICSGPNSALPHYAGNQRVIEEKDIVLLDFGCIYNNMWADMSRTIFVGEITEEQREIYNIVKEAQMVGENAAIEGAYIPDVDKAARNVIIKAGYGDKFVTRLGHGIGYSMHEGPDIKASNKRRIERGMVFSIEPGIYQVGKFGIRIENIIAITDHGQDVLNKSTRDIIIV